MGDKTGIQWTDATWNPFTGCTHVSDGCDHCYAAQLASGRLAHVPAYEGLASGGRFNGKVNLLPDRLDQPLRWRRPRRIFVNSMGDAFHEGVPDEYVARMFAVMGLAHWHQFQVLTKRHGRMRSLLSSSRFTQLLGNALVDLRAENPKLKIEHVPLPPLPNVWLGVSVENQRWADTRIPALLDTPAAVRFLSCEPLLGPVSIEYTPWVPEHLKDWPGTHNPLTGEWWPCEAGNYAKEYEGRVTDLPKIDWVIVGGESGPGARPMHPDWARKLRDECEMYEVPFFFKQVGEWGWRSHMPPGQWIDPWGPDGDRVKFVAPDGTVHAFSEFSTWSRMWAQVYRVGKHAAGRELDGRTWDEFPEQAW